MDESEYTPGWWQAPVSSRGLAQTEASDTTQASSSTDGMQVSIYPPVVESSQSSQRSSQRRGTGDVAQLLYRASLRSQRRNSRRRTRAQEQEDRMASQQQGRTHLTQFEEHHGALVQIRERSHQSSRHISRSSPNGATSCLPSPHRHRPEVPSSQAPTPLSSAGSRQGSVRSTPLSHPWFHKASSADLRRKIVEIQQTLVDTQAELYACKSLTSVCHVCAQTVRQDPSSFSVLCNDCLYVSSSRALPTSNSHNDTVMRDEGDLRGRAQHRHMALEAFQPPALVDDADNRFDARDALSREYLLRVPAFGELSEQQSLSSNTNEACSEIQPVSLNPTEKQEAATETQQQEEDEADKEAQGHPEEYCCPITYDLFVDPVVASDGFTYERDAISHWIRENPVSPLTRQRISDKLYPNNAMRTLVINYRESIGLPSTPQPTQSFHDDPDAEMEHDLAGVPDLEPERILFQEFLETLFDVQQTRPTQPMQPMPSRRRRRRRRGGGGCIVS
eukprot:m.225444 g.225444  ORF g.225444 m.225444 type:complete len:504 (-) comp17041_c0_seq7:4857-6368(-)